MAQPSEAPASGTRLVDHFQRGLDAPICLTWELTYACNLSCVHCLSSSGRRDPRELDTAEARSVIDELRRMQVFYVNIGGGEPTVRPDFFELVSYATGSGVGVKFSTNGVRITPAAARRLAADGYVDVQVSLDGATPEVNDAVRGPGSYATAMRALGALAGAGLAEPKLSVVVTRHNAGQLDDFKRIADEHGARLRLTRLRPAGRGADVWDELHPTADQQRALYDWLLEHGEEVLTGDSFFHLSAYGRALPGLNLCGAGRVVCLIDPVGDVYACPFAIHDRFRAGSVRGPGGFAAVWRGSGLFAELRRPQDGGACSSCGAYDSCRGGCMAAKFFTGLPLDGPDPECVKGHGAAALAEVVPGSAPAPSCDHSHRTRPRRAGPVPVAIGRRPPEATAAPPAAPCDESPLAGFSPAAPEA
ncbi:mycofactocin radical SAM maturase [Nocardiopsis potens]|uniref:mycofactocin radical SAM maturase n=1 Tax=Nocardiopsis potens TaxID=1246458 RepID=UPI000348AF7C|nr:mycofactocin radical SAM maturase [Nocardiopsis potens]